MPDYAGVLRRAWWLIALAVVAGMGTALFISLRETAVYEAKAVVTLQSVAFPSNVVGLVNQLAVNQPDVYAASQAQLARSPSVLAQAAETASVPGTSAAGLARNSSVSSSSTTTALTFAARSKTPTASIKLVNAYADSFVSYTTRLNSVVITHLIAGIDRQIARVKRELSTSGRANGVAAVTLSSQYSSLVSQRDQLDAVRAAILSDSAVAQEANSAAKVEPTPVRSALLGALVGLIIGVGLAFLRDGRGTYLHGPDEVSMVLGLRILGGTPAPPRRLRRKRQLVMLAEPRSELTESYRKVSVAVLGACARSQARSIMITSAVPAEGKSTTAGNLAVAMARAGKRVLLVDLDLREPSIHTYFDVPRAPGVTDVVRGSAQATDALHRVLGEREPAGITAGVLTVVPAGSSEHDPLSVMQSGPLAELVPWLESVSDIVLIDTPPALPFGDTAFIATIVQGSVVVARPDVANRHALASFARELVEFDCPTLGVIVAGKVRQRAYGYGYGYTGAPSSQV